MLMNQILKETFNLNELQLEQFKTYYSFLIEYNEKTNLTALSSEKDVYLKHFYDSLLISQNIDLNKIDTLSDLGTGAGFPSIPLKILFPHLKIFLIDSSLKKINFLESLVKKLNLTDVFLFHQRIEQHDKQYDLVIARALGKLKLILKLASPLIKKKGYFIAMKGPNYEAELKHLKMTKIKLKQKFFLELPEELGKRVNLLFQKIN
ncbi:16S rRNA (guanine(527)-N(7))-methyltransferase RsmG [Candidatus Phytoplasma pruni]|uniref:Ribosomal RNA small subunit methyltransferase G n=1 Tax=Candidatus Phytoplasma pruni TaxID=479893 RepID=A0A851HK47_9MOLU|nr:16S rRNA (guanine(527)-N(7))-methyltransferase RsmG [Candidatus Phytoplasma pruni]NWN45809.1 16S rRNA (guanine(527)-N(7))-methyltransferase RsmG [Candidatus Phytoplasma pruni]